MLHGHIFPEHHASAMAKGMQLQPKRQGLLHAFPVIISGMGCPEGDGHGKHVTMVQSSLYYLSTGIATQDLLHIFGSVFIIQNAIFTGIIVTAILAIDEVVDSGSRVTINDKQASSLVGIAGSHARHQISASEPDAQHAHFIFKCDMGACTFCRAIPVVHRRALQCAVHPTHVNNQVWPGRLSTTTLAFFMARACSRCTD